jgi:hypothetical protein
MYLIELIAQFADIDTRRAMGFQPRKLPPSDLHIKVGIKRWSVGKPFSCVEFIRNIVMLETDEEGNIWWHWGLRNYYYSRPDFS